MVNRENVFPFAASRLAASPRRGAPDKSPTAAAKIDIECRNCEGRQRPEPPVFVAAPGLFCQSCETEFPLLPDEAAAD